MPYKDPADDYRNRVEYRKKNKELIKQQLHNYYIRHKVKLKVWAKEYKSRPEVRARQRELFVLKRYNLTLLEHTLILENQGYKCAFPNCEVVVDIYSPVDHSHDCCPEIARSCGKCVRGVLCTRHNLGLGCFENNPKCLHDAFGYLEKFKPLTV